MKKSEAINRGFDFKTKEDSYIYYYDCITGYCFIDKRCSKSTVPPSQLISNLGNEVEIIEEALTKTEGE